MTAGMIVVMITEMVIDMMEGADKREGIFDQEHFKGAENLFSSFCLTTVYLLMRNSIP